MKCHTMITVYWYEESQLDVCTHPHATVNTPIHTAATLCPWRQPEATVPSRILCSTVALRRCSSARTARRVARAIPEDRTSRIFNKAPVNTPIHTAALT